MAKLVQNVAGAAIRLVQRQLAFSALVFDARWVRAGDAGDSLTRRLILRHNLPHSTVGHNRDLAPVPEKFQNVDII